MISSTQSKPVGRSQLSAPSIKSNNTALIKDRPIFGSHEVQQLSDSQVEQLKRNLSSVLDLIHKTRSNTLNISRIEFLKHLVGMLQNEPEDFGLELTGSTVKNVMDPNEPWKDIDLAVYTENKKVLDVTFIRTIVDQILKEQFEVEDPRSWYALKSFSSTNNKCELFVLQLGRNNTQICFSNQHNDYSFLDKARRISLLPLLINSEKINDESHIELYLRYLKPKPEVDAAITKKLIHPGRFFPSWDKVPKCFEYLAAGWNYETSEQALDYYKELAQYWTVAFNECKENKDYRKHDVLFHKFKSLDAKSCLIGYLDICARWNELESSLNKRELKKPKYALEESGCFSFFN